MKKSIIALALVVASVSAIGQGTVQFANLGVGLNAPVTIDSLAGAKGAAGYMAQLALDVGGSLTPVGAASSFIGAGAPGYFSGGVVTVSQLAPGASGTFRVFAWDSTAGAATTYAAALTSWNSGLTHGGWSAPITIATGGGGTPAGPPASLTGLQPWFVTIVPEPSTIALGILGVGALLLRRRN
jgi:hypothetical protein